MTLLELREAARRRLDDLVEGYGWVDADLNAWINEAIREAALRGRLNRATTTVSVVSGTASYALAATVDYVHSVVLGSTRTPLERVGLGVLEVSLDRWSTATGTPRAFFIEGRTLTLSPIPDANDTLTLVIDAIPALLSSDASSPVLETQDHLPLLEWVIYRAGQQRDVDTLVPNPEQYEVNFSRYFGPRPGAKTRRAWLEQGGGSTCLAY